MTSSLEGLKEVLGEVLRLGKRTAKLSAETRLFGSMPELDSMAIVLLAVAIEERFGIRFDDEEITAETFATIGTLLSLVTRKQSS